MVRSPSGLDSRTRPCCYLLDLDCAALAPFTARGGLLPWTGGGGGCGWGGRWAGLRMGRVAGRVLIMWGHAVRSASYLVGCRQQISPSAFSCFGIDSNVLELFVKWRWVIICHSDGVYWLLNAPGRDRGWLSNQFGEITCSVFIPVLWGLAVVAVSCFPGAGDLNRRWGGLS